MTLEPRGKELSPIGTYDLMAVHIPSQIENPPGAVICTSDASPIHMDISYVDDGEAFYTIGWPTNLSREAATEGIRGIGRQAYDTTYRCWPPGSNPALTIPKPMVSSLEKEDLEEALTADFGQLVATLPHVLVAYIPDPSIASPPRGAFGLRSLDSDPVTEPFIGEIVERTIAVEHVGGVAVALETLAAIFDRYKEQDVAALID